MPTEYEMQLLAECTRSRVWQRFTKLYPKLAGKLMPSIKLNRRLKVTAGNAYFTLREIHLSVDLFAHNVQGFVDEIIPHEIAHQVAYDLFGDEGHGPAWKNVMRTFGLDPARCHRYTTPAMRAKAARKGY